MQITNLEDKKLLVKRLLESKAISFEEALSLLQVETVKEYIPSTFTYPYWYSGYPTAGSTLTFTSGYNSAFGINPDTPL
jgi:hypothetical protein